MRRIVQKTLIITLLYISSIPLGHAFDIDETIDDEIRKNYNPTKLIQDTKTDNSALDKNIKSSEYTIDENLPTLPNITKYGSSTKNSDIKQNSTTPLKPYTGGSIKIKAGTSFNVINTTALSDWQRKGTKVKFATKGNTFGKQYTIPSGIVFEGEIIESHQPQITCNGGLIVIKVYSMIYKNQKIPVAAYVTRANDKKIFLNNIKGERNYLKTTWQKGNWGRTLFNKMLTVSIGLGSENSTLILSPFPFVYGTICLGLNTITSPICAFFSKGGHVSIPAKSNFRIKLIDDVMIN